MKVSACKIDLRTLAILVAICTATQPTIAQTTVAQTTVAQTAGSPTASLLDQAEEAQRKAVAFFHGQVAVHGGYVYQVTSDLALREGEGDAGKDSVWVQPPATPLVGITYVQAYERTGEAYLLKAAQDAAECLLQGQLHSGGWQNHIDFSPELRPKLAYRVDGEPGKKARNISSLDDDQTQAALRFLMKLDQVLKFQDARLHEAVKLGLGAVMRNQFPNGAWSQGFDVPNIDQPKDLKASYPDTWPREYPGGDYWFNYTLNDQALVRVLQTMWIASEIYQSDEYRQSALRAADFLLAAQMPEPQPAWSQQYNYQMQPVWARKFEPPAVSGAESQVVIDALMDMAIYTGDSKYLAPIPRALEYLNSSSLPDGQLARFYELKTNKPLYFTKDYQLTYSDADLPTHYGFKIDNQLDKLTQRYQQLKNLNADGLKALRDKVREPGALKSPKVPSDKAIAQIITAQDPRGAWVEPGKLKYIKATPKERPMIKSETFIKNLDQLSRYIQAKSKAR